jgi:hypothetical protein
VQEGGLAAAAQQMPRHGVVNSSVSLHAGEGQAARVAIGPALISLLTSMTRPRRSRLD